MAKPNQNVFSKGFRKFIRGEKARIRAVAKDAHSYQTLMHELQAKTGMRHQ